MPTPRLVPNPENCSHDDLETARKCTPTQQASVRMMAIRALLIGTAFSLVAAIFSVDSRSLTRWIKAFNERGIDGLIDEPRSGRPRALSTEKTEEYRNLVDHPEAAGETHWTARKFHGYLTSTLGEQVGYSTVIRWLHEQNFRLLVPRPWPDRQDEEKRREYLEKLRQLLTNDDVELWYTDESGFEGDPRPRRRWAQRGSSPKRVKNGDHLRTNFVGALCPRTGELSGIEVSGCDTEVFQAFLDVANSELHFERPINYLVMDNASWHKSKGLNWGKFTPLYLPPYSPDFNPIERLWLLIKNEWFSDFVSRTRDQLSDRVEQAILWAIDCPERVRKMCTIKTEL